MHYILLSWFVAPAILNHIFIEKLYSYHSKLEFTFALFKSNLSIFDQPINIFLIVYFKEKLTK